MHTSTTTTRCANSAVSMRCLPTCTIRVLLFTVLIALLYSSAPAADLYPIKHGDRWGYIDASGAVVITPRFREVSFFYGEYAAVRLNGSFGYIDTTGAFVIPPQFDYAWPLYDSTANVVLDGQPALINDKGDVLVRYNYESVQPFYKNNYAIATIESGRYGLINRKGELITDTVFSEISYFADGPVAVVKGIDYRRNTEAIGVIDTAGRWIVPFGMYRNITNFDNGYAKVTIRDTTDKSGFRTGYINTRGQQVFAVSSGKWDYPYYPDSYPLPWGVVVDIKTKRGNTACQGIIDSTGAITASNASWENLVLFSTSRMFIQKKNTNRWMLADLKGKIVCRQKFDEILSTSESYLMGERAFVRIGDKHAVIDTSGKIVAGPKKFPFPIGGGSICGDVVELSPVNPKLFLSGIWNTRTGAVVAPVFESIGMLQLNPEMPTLLVFDNVELIPMVRHGLMEYINRNGETVWAEAKVEVKEDSVLNVNFMSNRSYSASSAHKKLLEKFRGWLVSENEAKEVTPDVPAAAGVLQVVLDTTRRLQYEGRYEAMAMYVVNNAKDTVYFDAEDSRLHLCIQALSRSGEWKNIEFFAPSTCGNSYHTLFLEHGQYWEFATPVYAGEIKTRLRARLEYKTNRAQREPSVVYSNEVEGYINAGQFWRKPSRGSTFR